MTKRLAGTFVLVLGIAAFAGSAFAGNGNGNGNGRADAGAASAPAEGSQGAASGGSANAPGQVKKDAASTEATDGGSADQNAGVQAGVKPTNASAHDTHAAASSDQTKLYGNGQTAGQVAIRNGAPRSTILHGPGNSQPHKAAPCSRGHEVDVHALKAKGHRQACGTTSSPPGSTPGSNTSTDPGRGSNTAVSTSSNASDPGSKSAGSGSSPTRANVSSNAGVRASSVVLGATEAVGQGTLPFTGFPLWIAVLVALVLIVLGLALRRRGRATV